jgi:hypothetical protein
MMEVPMKSFLVRHPILRARLALAGRLATLLGTSYFLIATEYTEPVMPNSTGQICEHPNIRVTYQVTGSCGPAGPIVMISPKDECAIGIQGAADLGLPSAGRFTSPNDNSFDLSKGRWTIDGYLPEGAASALPSPDAGPFTVTTGPGGTPSGDPVAHDALVVRKCQAQTSSSGVISLVCSDCRVGSTTCNSAITACTATLREP